MKAHPGRITDEELEREDGGSGLRYTFSVDTDSGVQELGVDAATGQVLEKQSRLKRVRSVGHCLSGAGNDSLTDGAIMTKVQKTH